VVTADQAGSPTVWLGKNFGDCLLAHPGGLHPGDILKDVFGAAILAKLFTAPHGVSSGYCSAAG